MFRLRGALRILGCMLSLTLAAGCSDACRDVASQICGCLPDDGTRAACNQRAQDLEASFPLRSEDVQYCQHLLDTNSCDCAKINTAQGRLNCGMAYQLSP